LKGLFTFIYPKTYGCLLNHVIYWKVIAVDEFGAYFETEAFKFKTNYSNSPTFTDKTPIVFVHVYDKVTTLPIPGAMVSFVSGMNTENLTMHQRGVCTV